MAKKSNKKRRAARNAKKGLNSSEPEEVVRAPHSFVIHRGHLGKNANELLLNFRKTMEPYTASQLKVQKQNVLKDFVHIAGPLNVTHIVVFTKSETAMYLRFIKLPHGPTLTFQIKEYSLIRDIISSQKKSLIYEKLFEHHPLLTLNNFSGEGMHFKLMATMFQNMFPSINVNKTNLNTIRRCLLLNYNADKTIDLRQYAIKVVPAGVSKPVKKLIQSKVPNLSRYQNIDDFLQKSGNLSDSEVEVDSAANTVTLPQPIATRGNIASEKSAIRLYEIGPRMKLLLVKIEEGVMTGEVLYHEFVKKSPEEIKALKARLKAKKLLKQQRREQQKINVEKKRLANKKEDNEDAKEDSDEREEDLKWYREEVGEEPDEDLVPGIKKRKAPVSQQKPAKRVKLSKHDGKRDKQSKDDGKRGKQSPGKKPNEKPKTIQEFLKRRKKKKEAKVAKQKAKRASHQFLSMRAKHNVTKKQKKKGVNNKSVNNKKKM